MVTECGYTLKIASAPLMVLMLVQQPPPKDYLRYYGRSGKATQNVMGVVDFDVRFTYASIGQPGSMHDTTSL